MRVLCFFTILEKMKRKKTANTAVAAIKIFKKLYFYMPGQAAVNPEKRSLQFARSAKDYGYAETRKIEIEPVRLDDGTEE